jgi:Cu+-exporting ATPase
LSREIVKWLNVSSAISIQDFKEFPGKGMQANGRVWKLKSVVLTF